MPGNIKIAIKTQDTSPGFSAFSIRLKKTLTKESAVYFQPSRIVLLNGLQCNFAGMVKYMIQCGIIDKSLHWMVGDSHVVLTGNCLNGSDESIRLLWLIYSLESKAMREGGYLHFLPGRSELINCSGAWSQKHPEYAIRSSQATHQYAILYHGNLELYRWLLTKNILEKIGDATIVQCHLPEQLVQFLPKFPGKKTPDDVEKIIRLPLEDISAERLQYLHQTLETKRLLITDSETGRVCASFKGKTETHLLQMPLLLKQDKYFQVKISDEIENS